MGAGDDLFRDTGAGPGAGPVGKGSTVDLRPGPTGVLHIWICSANGDSLRNESTTTFSMPACREVTEKASKTLESYNDVQVHVHVSP